MILHYLIVFDPQKSPYWAPAQYVGDLQATTDARFTPNSVDEFVINYVRLAGRTVDYALREGRASRRVYLWLCRQVSQRSEWETTFRSVSGALRKNRT